MSYIDGFVIAVPTANKQKFIEHARQLDPMLARREQAQTFDDMAAQLAARVYRNIALHLSQRLRAAAKGAP